MMSNLTCAQGEGIVGQRLHHSYAIIPLDFQKTQESVSINDKQVELWAKLMSEKTPTNITFILLLCSLLPHSLCNIKTLPLCTYSISGKTRGQHSRFNWCYFHLSAPSCVFWRNPWLLMWVTMWRGASNLEVANNQNNLGTVCLCGATACMYCLSFFQLLQLWLNVHFQQSARSKNYWAPLGFTHSLTLISFLRSDEKWGRSWAGLTKEVRVESSALYSHSRDC